MYQPRTYHSWVGEGDLAAFSVAVKETELFIRAKTDLKRKAEELVRLYRRQLEDFIERCPRFAASFRPIAVPDDAPDIVKEMSSASAKVNVGPMAAVAGAIAQAVGTGLLAYSPEVIVENGGDIFIKSLIDRTIGIYAGDSPFTGKLGLEIKGEDTPLGICTSSGTVGPSISFGETDAAIAISNSATLADAAATAIGNLVRRPEDIDAAIGFARGVPGLLGAVIIQGNNLGVWGDVRLCEL
jgi:ApbE superfamily uncharacterized protein (UPF0280 family)